MEMKAHAYSPSSCGKSDEKPSLIHTRPSRRDGEARPKAGAIEGRLNARHPTVPSTFGSPSTIDSLLRFSRFQELDARRYGCLRFELMVWNLASS